MIGFELRNVRLFGYIWATTKKKKYKPNEYMHVSPQTFLVSLDSQVFPNDLKDAT
jgi:hypothetical protein